MATKSCMNYSVVITFVLINCLASCNSAGADVFKCMDGVSCDDGGGGGGMVLSRRKRSLTFPEGSSLQLGANGTAFERNSF
jgi:hypothetical protein